MAVLGLVDLEQVNLLLLLEEIRQGRPNWDFLTQIGFTFIGVKRNPIPIFIKEGKRWDWKFFKGFKAFQLEIWKELFWGERRVYWRN